MLSQPRGNQGWEKAGSTLPPVSYNMGGEELVGIKLQTEKEKLKIS
jgi:hypothetical protein